MADGKKRGRQKGAKKGHPFERWFCKRLSLWWSGGASDDIFWRTAGSGARATSRRKGGKRTANQEGDLCATDPSGLPLTDLITFELKRGYSARTLHDLLDFQEGKQGAQVINKWVEGVRAKAAECGRPFWAVVHRRDQREALVVLPGGLADRLGPLPPPSAALALPGGEDGRVCACRLGAFFARFDPDDLRRVHRLLGLGKGGP